MSTRPLSYRYKPNHRVSVPVFLRLQLTAFAHGLADLGVRPLAHGDSYGFVTGCGHSGTTLLASKLGLHPDVLLVSRESNLFLPERGLRLARVIAEEWYAFARQEDRRVILEKSPKHVHCVDRIRRLLPGARVIVMVRNPLDTCASLYRRFNDLDLAIERWRMDSEAALAALAADATLRVRYEDLTRDPAATLAAACTFLGLEWDPELLTRSGSAYGTHPGLRRNMALRHEQVSQPIYDNNDRWREVLDPRQASIVRERTAELAMRLGLARAANDPPPSTTTMASDVVVRRLPGNPIVRPAMLPGKDGANINGPSLIRVPSWVESPLGRYYLYFAHHKGTYLRLAYADRLEGPWKIHAPGVLQLENVPACRGHVASPDVIVDEERRQLRLYFHGPARAASGQRSFVALSRDGLVFEPREEILGSFYFRVFRHEGAWYAMAKGGVLYRSPDGLSAFEPGPNPFPGGELRSGPLNEPGPRHVAVLPEGRTLWVYYSSIGDRPERILRARMDLTPDWREWKAVDAAEVLRPQFDWEGAGLPLRASEASAAKAREHALRDPAVFVDEDERRYLIYAVAGESGLAIAELVRPASE